jgi:hypothetical protein
MYDIQGSKSPSRRLRWIVVSFVWFVVVVTGLSLLAQYNTTAGALGSAPSSWPQESRIQLSEQGCTLVMFAHPKCPCTRASLGELAKILTRCPNAVTTHVVFFKPADTPETWDQTDQWLTAANMPGVQVIRDIDGVEARLFQAATSGQTLLYNSSGELLFNGGITLARGHAGDNPGRGAIESYLVGAVGDVRQTPVFGCQILQLRSAQDQ